MMPFRNCHDTVLLHYWLETDMTYAEIHHQLIYNGYKLTVPQLKYRMKKILKHYGLVPANANARHYRLSRNKTKTDAGLTVGEDLN